MIPPLMFVWDGDAMIPHRAYSRLAEQSFTSGHAYRLMVDEERSTQSHNYYMAAVLQGWGSLPENITMQWPTPDHLRYHALICTGFCHKTVINCHSHSEALRTMRTLMQLDPYCEVAIDGKTLTHYKAKSQRFSDMAKGEFEQSKNAVLGWIADQIGCTADDLIRAGKTAA